MAQPNSQDTSTGNTHSKTLILAGDADHTVDESKPSQPLTSIESASIETVKPVSIQEALSLLQTLCLDLRSMKCDTAILADDRMVYFMVELPILAGKATVTDTGHVALGGVPVSVIDTSRDENA